MTSYRHKYNCVLFVVVIVIHYTLATMASRKQKKAKQNQCDSALPAHDEQKQDEIMESNDVAAPSSSSSSSIEVDVLMDQLPSNSSSQQMVPLPSAQSAAMPNKPITKLRFATQAVAASHRVLWHNTLYDYNHRGRTDYYSHSHLDPDVDALMGHIGLMIQGTHTKFVLVKNEISIDDEAKTSGTIEKLLPRDASKRGQPDARIFEIGRVIAALDATTKLSTLVSHLNPNKGALSAISLVSGYPQPHYREGLRTTGGMRDQVDGFVRNEFKKTHYGFQLAATDGIYIPNVVCYVVCRDHWMHHDEAHPATNRPPSDGRGAGDMLNAYLGPNRVHGFGCIAFESSITIILSCCGVDDESPVPVVPDQFEFYHNQQGELVSTSVDTTDNLKFALANHATSKRLHNELVKRYKEDRDDLPVLNQLLAINPVVVSTQEEIADAKSESDRAKKVAVGLFFNMRK